MYSLPLFAVAILLDFFFDVLRKTDRYKIPDSITSLSAGFLGVTAGVLTIGFVSFFYNGIFSSIHVFVVKDTLSSWILSAVLYDFIFYWYHRAHHRINFLWAIHSTHHNSEYFNFTTALRQSMLGFLTVWPFFLPMAFLGFSYEHYLFAAGLSTLYGFFTHTEFVRFVPYLEYVLVGPSSHRVHHGTNVQYLDKNFGSIFIIWDHIFGTHSFEKNEHPIRYGTTTQLRSFNPFYANLSLHWFLLKDAYLCKSWTDKFVIWFKKTGWRPVDQIIASQNVHAKNIVEDMTIFDSRITINELSYVVFNFGLAAVATAHLMVFLAPHSLLWIGIYTLLIWMVILSNSFYLNSNVLRFKFELLRLLLTGAATSLALQYATLKIDIIWFYLILSICAISVTALVIVYVYNFKNKSSSVLK